jgi:chromosome segregation ATPase
MPFSNNSQTVAPTNVDIKEEYRQIADRVSALQEQHRILGDKTIELDVLNKNMEESRKIHTDLISQIETLNEEKTKILKYQEQILSEISQCKQDLTTVKSTLEIENVNVQDLENRMRRYRDTLLSLESQVSAAQALKDASEVEVLESDKKLQEATAAFNAQTDDNQKKMDEQRVILADFEREIAKKTKDFEMVQQDISIAQTELVQIKKISEEVKKANEEAMALAVLETQKLREETVAFVASKEKELVEREGLVSRREAWQNEKQEKLAETKAEIEKALNRPIPISI